MIFIILKKTYLRGFCNERSIFCTNGICRAEKGCKAIEQTLHLSVSLLLFSESCPSFSANHFFSSFKNTSVIEFSRNIFKIVDNSQVLRTDFLALTAGDTVGSLAVFLCKSVII